MSRHDRTYPLVVVAVCYCWCILNKITSPLPPFNIVMETLTHVALEGLVVCRTRSAARERMETVNEEL